MLFQAIPEGGRRFWEFFTVNIRNPNTRRAYFEAVEGFATWCEEKGLGDGRGDPDARRGVLRATRPHPIEADRQTSTLPRSDALRLVSDRAHHGDEPGPCGTGTEAKCSQGQDFRPLCRRDAGTARRDRHHFPARLHDRALIALMGYTFARVGAATEMKVEDFYVQKRRGWVRLHEKGGKVTELPCHHNLDQYLEEWIAASRLGSEPEAPLFHTGAKLTTNLPATRAHTEPRRRKSPTNFGLVSRGGLILPSERVAHRRTGFGLSSGLRLNLRGQAARTSACCSNCAGLR